MAITNTALTTTAGNIFVNPAGNSGTSAITTIHLCNYTNNTQTVNVFVVPSGSVAGNATVIYSNYSLTAYNTLIVYAEKFILGTVGDAIMANCSNASAVTATVSSIGI
jgi:hypothetical protein